MTINISHNHNKICHLPILSPTIPYFIWNINDKPRIDVFHYFFLFQSFPLLQKGISWRYVPPHLGMYNYSFSNATFLFQFGENNKKSDSHLLCTFLCRMLLEYLFFFIFIFSAFNKYIERFSIGNREVYILSQYIWQNCQIFWIKWRLLTVYGYFTFSPGIISVDIHDANLCCIRILPSQ